MIHILLILSVLAVTAVLFCVWLIVSIVRFSWRSIGGNGRNAIGRSDARQCTRAGCRTVNPVHAQFCRRCGCSLAVEIAGNRTAARPAPGYHRVDGRGSMAQV